MRWKPIFIGSRLTASNPATKSCRRRARSVHAPTNFSMPLPIDYHMHPQAHSVKPYTPELLQPWADSARQRGLKEIAFTDHDRYHEGVNLDVLERFAAANPH